MNRDSGMRILDQGEIGTLLNSLEGCDRLAVMLGLRAGLRFDEVFRLEWADFNPDEGVLRIHNRKRNETVCVPLSEAVISELKTYIASSEGERLFEDQTAGLYNRFHREINGKLKRLVSDDITFSTLRNTFATHLLEAGVSILTAAKILGYKSVKAILSRHSYIKYLKKPESLN